MSAEQPTGNEFPGLSGLFDRLWRIMTGPRLTLVLFVWLSGIVGLSLLIPQSPYRIEDPLVRSQWLANIPREAWPVAEGLQPLGVFHLLTSAWLRLPLSLLLAHALVVLASRAPTAWQRVFRPASTVTSSIVGKSLRLVCQSDEQDVQSCHEIATRLKHAGHRVIVDEEARSIVAWRWRWGWLAPTALYAGLGLLALGLMLQGWLGQVHEINLAPGDAVPVPGAAPSNLVLEGVSEAASSPDAQDGSVVAMRAVSEAGDSQSVTLDRHESRLVRGIWLTVLDVRPMVEISAVDAQTGADLMLQPFVAQAAPRQRVRLPLAEDPDARFAGVPSQNVTLRVDYPTGDNRPRRLSLSFFRGVDAAPSFVGALGDGEQTTFDGVYYRVTIDHDVRVRACVGLWWVLIAVGWAMIAVGCGFLAVGRPVWVRSLIVPTIQGSRVITLVDTLADERVVGQQLRGLIIGDMRT